MTYVQGASVQGASVQGHLCSRGHSGDGCDLASTLCKYDLRNGDLFVLIWTRVR